MTTPAELNARFAILKARILDVEELFAEARAFRTAASVELGDSGKVWYCKKEDEWGLFFESYGAQRKFTRLMDADAGVRFAAVAVLPELLRACEAAASGQWTALLEACKRIDQFLAENASPRRRT